MLTAAARKREVSVSFGPCPGFLKMFILTPNDIKSGHTNSNRVRDEYFIKIKKVEK